MEDSPVPAGKNGKWELTLACLAGTLLVNAMLSAVFFKDGGAASAIASAMAVLVLSVPIFKIVIEDFKFGRTHMNELVLIAVLAGVSRGDLLTAGLIAFFMLIGLVIETRSASGARKSLEEVAGMTRLKARLISENGEEKTLDATSLSPGDLIRIRPGEAVPADGRIVSGESAIQEANITGESLPVDKSPDMDVFAGTMNLSGAIDVRVSRTGADTTIGKVKELILAAEQSRPRFVRMMDDYARLYTPMVLMFAFFTWALAGHEMSRVVAVLVAACPMALVLSAPTAAVAALSAAARLGILIRSIENLESVATVSAFVFDKTGTLTSGELEVAELAPCKGISSAELLGMAASVEKDSNHPVAKAIMRLARRAGVKVLPVSGLKEMPGRGVIATLGDSILIAGNLKWMKENNVDLSDFPSFDDEARSAMSMLFLAKNSTALGILALEDKPRNDASSAVRDLRSLSISSISIVTGDRNSVALKISRDLGIAEFHGECSPADKVESISNLKEEKHRTAFVGDGVNDAPALAASDIGIAMGAAGSGLAIETASIALMNNRLDNLPFLILLSRAYKRIMLQNFVLGAAFILVGVAAGAMGKLGAVQAALLQLASAIAIIMNSARLVRMEKRPTNEAKLK